jgi:hypothetical protein
MTRLTRRRIERALRQPVPAPDGELGRRIKAQIPEDLFGAATDAARREENTERPATPVVPPDRGRFGRPAAWALAASVAAVLGAGWLAVRMFEPRQPLGESAPSIRAADPPSLDRRFEAQLRERHQLEGGLQTAPVEKERAGLEAAAPAAAPVAQAFDQAIDAADGEERRSVVLADRLPASAPADVERPAPVPQERAAAAAPKREALAEPAPAAAAIPVGAATDRLTAKRMLAPAKEQRRLDAALGDLLDAAAGVAAIDPASPIAIAGARGRAPSRLLLLVTTSAGAASSPRRPADVAGTIDLDLDPVLIASQRLLARRTTAGRAIALYEIETRQENRPERAGARALDRSSHLATVRIRDQASANSGAPRASRPIVADDFTTEWPASSVALRLAVLGAELTLLDVDASPEQIASLRTEIEQALATSRLDEKTARAATELLEAFSPPTVP